MIVSNDKKVCLTQIEKKDLSFIQSWRNNQDFQRYFREYRLFSLTQKEKWHNSIIDDNRFEMFMIRNNRDYEPLGVAGLTYIDWVNRHADVHFYIGKSNSWIDEEYSSSAIDTVLKHAFHIFNLNKVWTEVYEIDNKKIDFFKFRGFKIDATHREHYFYGGKYHTSYILSLLRSEYE